MIWLRDSALKMRIALLLQYVHMKLIQQTGLDTVFISILMILITLHDEVFLISQMQDQKLQQISGALVKNVRIPQIHLLRDLSSLQF